MLNELLEMIDGGGEDGERACCQRRQSRAGGVRGLIARLLSGDEDNDREDDGRCCSGVTPESVDRDPGRPVRRRDRDERDDGFDVED